MGDVPVPSDIDEICRTVLVKSLRLRRGESLIVETWTHMLPWAEAFVLQARRAGIRTMLLYEDEATYWRSVESSKADDLGRMPDPELAAVSKADGYVFLWGPEDRPRRNALPKAQREALTGYNSKWYQAAGRAHLRGVRIELGRATGPSAAFYGVELGGWQQMLIDASRADLGKMVREATHLADRLRRGKQIRIHHANGTDLALRLAGRAPTADDGVVDPKDVRIGQNMASIPGGAVYVSVDEKFVEGRLVANRSTYPLQGTLTGGRWTFQDHHLASYTYRSGEELFKAAYDAAGPGRDRPGFLSIGLNPRIRDAPGLEDFERGGLLFGIGGNVGYGGKTKSPFTSWLALGGAHLEVDGRPLVADGEIL